MQAFTNRNLVEKNERKKITWGHLKNEQDSKFSYIYSIQCVQYLVKKIKRNKIKFLLPQPSALRLQQ
jgi:hypothetical protein